MYQLGTAAPEKDKMIMEPFNGVFFGCVAIFVFLLILSTIWARRQSEATRKTVFIIICLLSFASFFVYKYFLSIDTEYDQVAYAEMGGFNWWGELPLHVCNVNMLLIPLAVLLDITPMKSFGFFVGTLGAGFAICMPAVGFSGYSILMPRMIGFYFTHFMIIVEAIALVTWGFYRPRFRDIPYALLMVIGIAAVIFVIVTLIRKTGLNPRANYFYLMETEGISLLNVFYQWIQLPFFYLLPAIGILSVYMLAVTALFEIFGKIIK